MADKTDIAVLGAGSWGTALALALARNGHNINMWAHREKHVERMRNDRCNKAYLADFDFPENLDVVSDLSTVTQNHAVFLIVTPSHAFRSTVKSLKAHGLDKNSTLVWATKGFDALGPVLLSEVVKQELGENFNQAVVSGPSFSKEVAGDLPTAIAAAGSSEETTQYVARLFHQTRMRVYTSPDFIGVQVGGAMKNVMAIAAGISDGLGFGANSRSAIITRGLAEIARFGVALGAKTESFLGLAGMGDLVLTCSDDQSRNRRFGLGIGRGQSIEQTLKEIGQEVEGYTTTKEIIRFAQKHSVEMPISEQVHEVLYNGLAPELAVQALLERELMGE